MSKKHQQSEEVIDEQIQEPDYKALYQRSLADLENSRRRMEEEKRQFVKFAQMGFMEELFPVLTNFYRATEHVPADLVTSPWVSGILHIQNQLTKVLKDRGFEEINPQKGEAFDPNLHEALSSTTEGDVPDDRIASTVSMGFKLHDRVVVPAQVIVKSKE